MAQSCSIWRQMMATVGEGIGDGDVLRPSRSYSAGADEGDDGGDLLDVFSGSGEVGGGDNEDNRDE